MSLAPLLAVGATLLSILASSAEEPDDAGKTLQLMFFRPREPLTMPKGADNVHFDMPDGYVTELYSGDGLNLKPRTSDARVISVPEAEDLPDSDVAECLGRREPFSVFIPAHRNCAEQLIAIFMNASSTEDLASKAAYLRERVNPYLYDYALSVSLLSREETEGLELPPQTVVFPEKYFIRSVIAIAIEEANRARASKRFAIRSPGGRTASDAELENQLWYFREDVGINLAHWHWHLVNPPLGPQRVVNKHRRGEIFYYFHEQILARYNFERYCHNMERARSLSDWRVPVAEGYYSKLDSIVASRSWPPRAAFTRLSDVERPEEGISVSLEEMERYRDRIYQAIHAGYIQTADRNQVPLNNTRGIDILGNLVEASSLSANVAYYGNIHNQGHLVIAYAHDPKNMYLASFGVMADTATSMRDPIFYRWHAFINNIFLEHKNLLPPYSRDELSLDGVTVISVEVTSEGEYERNKLVTFWQESDIDLSAGLDFTPKGPNLVRITHLQHAPFVYLLRVENRGQPLMGTVRLFMAPEYDNRGQQLTFDDQRSQMIELDRFVVRIGSGNRTVTRKSEDSSVTIPFDRTFRNLYENRPAEGTAGEEQFNFCGCGWPQHMLVPRGSPQGTPAVLFAFISDYEQDKVEQADLRRNACSDSPAYCGIRRALYPDARPMGFPFDRRPPRGVAYLRHFLRPNMATAPVVIRFANYTLGLRTRSLAVHDW